MITIGFVGHSGTGKSFRAVNVAKENEIKFIIDDGLFINVDSSRIIAGKSAKRESTKLASVRCALFVDGEHANSVISAIIKEKPEKIMILGTSEQMVKKIAEVLMLPEISKFIYIEEVATESEISEAVRIRKEQGKHIIPVPTFEIKKDFSGYFIDTLRTFTGKGRQKTLLTEKTVVRPTFSYLGKFHISERVLSVIAKRATEEAEGVARANRVIVHDSGVYGAIIDIEITAKYGENIKETARQAQKRAKAKIEELTGINVLLLNVIVKAVVFNDR